MHLGAGGTPCDLTRVAPWGGDLTGTAEQPQGSRLVRSSTVLSSWQVCGPSNTDLFLSTCSVTGVAVPALSLLHRQWTGIIILLFIFLCPQVDKVVSSLEGQPSQPALREALGCLPLAQKNKSET